MIKNIGTTILKDYRIKYKIGDRVIVKPLSWFENNCSVYYINSCKFFHLKQKTIYKYEINFVGKMIKYCNKILIIKDILNKEVYAMFNDGDMYHWQDWMFYSIDKNKFKRLTEIL
jgi:hypothetical protein